MSEQKLMASDGYWDISLKSTNVNVKVYRIHPLGAMNDFTKFSKLSANPSSRYWGVSLDNWKFWPIGYARRRVRGSPELLRVILWTPWIFVPPDRHCHTQNHAVSMDKNLSSYILSVFSTMLAPCQSVGWSTTLVQVEIPQQLLDRLLLNLAPVFMSPRGWILLTLVSFSFSATSRSKCSLILCEISHNLPDGLAQYCVQTFMVP